MNSKDFRQAINTIQCRTAQSSHDSSKTRRNFNSSGVDHRETASGSYRGPEKEKGRIGEVLVKLGLITEEHIAEALGTQMGIPYYSSKILIC